MQTQERTGNETKPTLKVTSLLEVEAFRRRCSDRLLKLPPVFEATRDLYSVCDVLPQEPTDDQLGDLAFRLSNFLEDAHRHHVDRRADSSEIGALAPPMSMPIVHRSRLREARTVAVDKRVALQVDGWPACVTNIAERETICMFYLNVPRWSEPVRWTADGKVLERLVRTREEQVAVLDAVARRHGLRCVEPGRIPQPGE